MSDAIAAVMFAVGLFFMVVSAVGFARLPDVFCRLHVTCILDTLGAPLVLLGVAVHVGLSLTAGKMVLAAALLYLTSPLIGHLLGRAALEGGYRPREAHGDLPPGVPAPPGEDEQDGMLP